MGEDEAMTEHDAAHLIVMRHAKTQEVASSDRARKLTARGENDARAAGEWLAAAGWRPDLLLVSPADRARQTADLVATALGSSPDVVIIDELYGADAPEVLRICTERVGADVGCAAVVGHNPTMAGVAMLLQAHEDHTLHLRPGSLAVFEFQRTWDRLGPGCARLVDRYSPHGD